MTAPIAFLDIGGTLVNGPPKGPAARLAAPLDLSGAEQERLRTALMTHRWEHPQSVTDFVCEGFAKARPAAEHAIARLWADQEVEATPIEGAIAAITAIAESGLRLAIISNIWHPYLVAVERHFGGLIDRFVDPALRFYSYREGVAKPSEEIFRRALSAAKCEPREAVMIGDSYREDIEPAANLGLNTIWMFHRPAKEAPNVLRVLNGIAPRPTQTLSSIEELNPGLLWDIFYRNRPRGASGGYGETRENTTY
jgi:HAD superfamily hydrolase (TIGR01509 family)